MASLIAIVSILVAGFTLARCTPFKRQAGFWNNNNELGNSLQGGFPNNIPSNNFGPSWGNDQPIWDSQPNRPPPLRPNRPPPRQPNRPPPRPNRPTQRPTSRPITVTTASSDSTTPSVQPFLTLHVPPEGCPCLRTAQFNPVCGSDSNTYANMALLQCYQNCGTNVAMRYMGSCRRSG